MNVELLRRITTHILEDPRRCIMASYYVRKDENVPSFKSYDFPPCGTAACIAGWAVLLFGGDPNLSQVREQARRNLGLTVDEGETLFEVAAWPERFQHMLPLATRGSYYDEGTPGFARVVVLRIEHLITTGE